MTNEQIKQKAIQEAYGEYWNEVKDFVNGNGWYTLPGDKKTEAFYNFLGNCDMRRALDFRPKSLAGIDDNNSWIRIEQDGSNLHVDTTKRYIFGCLSDEIFTVNYCMGVGVNAVALKMYAELGEATHYRPVVEQPKPVY